MRKKNRDLRPDSVRYRVLHSSDYQYGDEIMLAHHFLHLSPRTVPNQRLIDFQMEIQPRPAIISTHADFFHNPAVYLEIHAPHERLTVKTRIEVEVRTPALSPATATVPWETLRDRLALSADETARAATGFAHASAMIPFSADLVEYAAPSFTPGRPIGAAAIDLTERIYEDFTFDPEATTISTPIAQVLAERRGVCQDFAHLQVGCLRALGLSARYISGYLRTLPPPGKKRLVGADVSHAWLSVWCGDDWLDLDPTNGRAGSVDMITLAWGRDYDDVSPLRGVILGSRVQKLTVEVDVEPIEGDLVESSP